LRLFLAIKIPANIRNEITERIVEIKRLGPKVRWIAGDNLHITIVFLGEINREKAQQLEKICNRVIPELSVFEIGLGKLGLFSHKNKPKIIWLGINEGKENLQKLYKKLTIYLQEKKFNLESRSYIPHLTLGKIKTEKNKEVEDLVETTNLEKKWCFRVEEIKIMSSELSSSGAVYKEISNFRLQNLSS